LLILGLEGDWLCRDAGTPGAGYTRAQVRRQSRYKDFFISLFACHPGRADPNAKPEIVVALGATAARSLLGRVVTISSVRGGVKNADSP